MSSLRTVGILALQGAFIEHFHILERLHIPTILVRTPSDLSQCTALIIPGGESTTIANLLLSSSLLLPIRTFILQSRYPTWGTCAGAILLSDHLLQTSQKKGGQVVIGGLNLVMQRNGFGSQLASFEGALHIADETTFPEPKRRFMGVFIRAPIIHTINDPEIEVVARLGEEDGGGIAAVKKGNILITTFHPELETEGDERFHQYFIDTFVNTATPQ